MATSVFVFDVSIQTIHDIPDMLAAQGIGGGRTAGLTLFPGGEFAIPFRCVMPIGAGVIVAWLQAQVCLCEGGGQTLLLVEWRGVRGCSGKPQSVFYLG